MNRVRSQTGGYTVVETLIFLAVSGVLFVTAMIVVGGQQAKTEFAQSVRDINSQIQDTLNDVATGYYSTPGGFSCSYDATGPHISNLASNAQGTNADCIFIARVMAFGVNGDNTVVNVYNVVGNRLDAPAGQPAITLPVTHPTALAPTSLDPSIPNTTQRIVLPGGLTIGAMVSDVGGSQTTIGAVGFFSTLGQTYNGSLAGGQTTQILPIANTNWATQTSVTVADVIKSNNYTSPVINPSGGVKICLISAGTSQTAIITIGGNGKLSTKLDIKSVHTCPPVGSL